MISFFPAFGINFLFWSVVGFLRLIFERLRLGSVVFGTIAGSMFFHGGVYLTESIYMLSDPHGTGLPFDDITVILTILVFWIVGGLIVTYIYVAFAPKVSRVDAVLVYFIYVYISIIFHVGIASTGSENMVIITLIALGGDRILFRYKCS
jgi:hypothetical protein